MNNLSSEAFAIIIDALEISSSVKVYGDGRREHQEAVERAKQEITSLYA